MLRLLDRRVLRLFVRCADGSTVDVVAEASYTASDLMQHIDRKTGTPAQAQLITFSRQFLIQGDRRLEEYGVRDGSTLELFVFPACVVPGQPPTATTSV